MSNDWKDLVQEEQESATVYCEHFIRMHKHIMSVELNHYNPSAVICQTTAGDVAAHRSLWAELNHYVLRNGLDHDLFTSGLTIVPVMLLINKDRVTLHDQHLRFYNYILDGSLAARLEKE